MNKGQLIDKIYRETNYQKKDIEAILSDCFRIIRKECINGGSVTIREFGKFDCYRRKSHPCWNPNTGEMMINPAKTVFRFKAGKFSNNIIKNSLPV